MPKGEVTLSRETSANTQDNSYVLRWSLINERQFRSSHSNLVLSLLERSLGWGHSMWGFSLSVEIPSYDNSLHTSASYKNQILSFPHSKHLFTPKSTVEHVSTPILPPIMLEKTDLSRFTFPPLPALAPFLRDSKTYQVIFGGVLSIALLLAVLVVIDNARRSKIDLPGPSGWPLIGIGLDLPARPRKMLKGYREKYGDAFKMRLGWYDWVLFNTREGVREVFDRQVGATPDCFRAVRSSFS